MGLPKSHPLHGIPNLGPAMARDFERLGVARREALAAQDADDLYLRLCRLDGRRQDPCVWDVFAAVIDYVNGGPPLPWWKYSAARKKRQALGRFPRFP